MYLANVRLVFPRACFECKFSHSMMTHLPFAGGASYKATALFKDCLDFMKIST